MQTYNATDVDLVLEWVDKYFEINTLINKVFGSENLEKPPPYPSFENEVEYQRLRSWFRKNQDKFVPIWDDFCVSKGYSIECTVYIDEMEYSKNPFLYYKPYDLLYLAYTFGATLTADTWDPDEQAVELILNNINRFCCTMIHLAHWIGEFADIGGQSS